MKTKKILTAVFLGLLVAGLINQAPTDGANFKLVGDVLDNFGGGGSSTNFSLRISSGGQPSPVTKMASTSFKAFSGYVPEVSFWHGDCTGNSLINLEDVICLAKHILSASCVLRPVESGAVTDLRSTCDNQVNLADVIYLANFVLRSGPKPCNL